MILWVGNLSKDTLDVDLLSLFAKHRVLDCGMTLSTRNSALMYFRRAADAKTVKDVFQGALIHGFPISIKFARSELPLRCLAGSVNKRRYDPHRRDPLDRERGDCQVCLDQKCGHHERGYSVSRPPITRKAARNAARHTSKWLRDSPLPRT